MIDVAHRRRIVEWPGSVSPFLNENGPHLSRTLLCIPEKLGLLSLLAHRCKAKDN